MSKSSPVESGNRMKLLDARLLGDQNPDVGDKNVAREVVDDPHVRFSDSIRAEICCCGFELRGCSRITDIDSVASLWEIRCANCVAGLSSIVRGILKTLDRGHRLEKPQSVRQHLVGHV